MNGLMVTRKELSVSAIGISGRPIEWRVSVVLKGVASEMQWWVAVEKSRR
jgi:hypothetical protein